ncbi:ferrous iron transport protein B [Vibrio europaeus]|uniref:Ferrous iron transport protein B n=1 Tax=Vibrio europaeus TaxID=300876 RepID=A0A178JAQ3_9VIBR|nr:ferrous iron transport protein B [Vibrio europaeus]MDC5704256.1 ferrous iron transport protein B [Vibrio europaeus]MDC5707963.1 ferrous iron transport protein B [Vibrio europaeus]MDC5714476.1 ferrous iron transport protein B [Vibrio europaeus]MDC5718344.1 ferrous iron transport protein B [Vibrio europaeus]MDC5725061.1 ferrous iron transport protein B [Vibrio europaeus]
MQRTKVLLAGQQNAGKSTIFNMLTGARQHVANYPGVTVDKKTGYFSNDNGAYQLIDLPGTYSLSCFSLEERVARDALRNEAADVVLNVVDSANLNRSLHLTMQLLEMELPLALALNMMDVAQAEGITIDSHSLSQEIGVPVVECIGRKGKGVEGITTALVDAKIGSTPVEYPLLEPELASLTHWIDSYIEPQTYSTRWLALRLLERDSHIEKWLDDLMPEQQLEQLNARVEQHLEEIAQTLNGTVSDYVVAQRHQRVSTIIERCTTQSQHQSNQLSLTDKIDKVVLNKFGAPLFLIATVFIIYQSSIVYGYELTNYWWPYLAAFRELVASLLPEAGFLHDPYVRSLGLWIVDSANTLLNYIPIFLILFALIAILEDSGYMARIAFISDRVLNRFGLHGQSTLPMILAGVFAGGCAVPGVMATKGIPDNRARIATILTVPYMNCLAKVPLYTLLLGIFFVEDKSLMTFYISTISIIAALLVAKLLTKSVLRRTEQAPFVMELPRYNLPTARSVVTRAMERTWMYVRKVGTIVLAVSTIIFVLLQFPGVPEQELNDYQLRAEKAVAQFQKAAYKTQYADAFDQNALTDLVNFYTDYRQAKLNAKGAQASQKVNADFQARNELYFSITARKGDKDAKKLNKPLRKLASERKKIRREMKERRLEASLLGSFGRSIEPVTQFAGFDWKINVALFSSFAARESSVATLGVLFQPEEDSNQKLEQRMAESDELAGHGEVAAVALILFFILYPPCLATVMMIKVQTGQYKWLLLSIFLPTLLGFTVATAVYTIGTRFALSGIQVMSLTYFSALLALLMVGLRDSAQQKKQGKPIPIQMIEK